MALTKETRNDKIEVLYLSTGHAVVQVRTAVIVSEDGEELSRSYSRRIVTPDADLTQEDADVSAICTPVFTDAVKAAYQTHLSSQE